MQIESVAKIDGEDRKITVEFDFGTNLADAIAKFGEAVVYNNYLASGKVSAQAFSRTLAQAVDKEGIIVNSDEDIQQKMDEWKVPDKTGRKADKSAKLLALWASLSEEDKVGMREQMVETEEEG